MKHFALIELGNDEAPSVGVITNIINTKLGREIFKESFLKAVGNHFDIEDFNFSEIEDIFNEPYVDVDIEVEGFNYTVRIVETWIY